MKEARLRAFKVLDDMNRKTQGHKDWFITEFVFAIPEEFDQKGKCTIPVISKTLDYGHRERPWGRIFKVQIVPDKDHIIQSDPSYTYTGERPKYETDAIFYRRLVQTAQDFRLISKETSRTLRRWIRDWEKDQEESWLQESDVP